MWSGFIYILEHSYVSLAGVIFLLIAAYSFVPSKLSRKKRAIVGVLHVSAHLASALILMLLLEIGIETCIRHKLLATSGFILQPFELFLCLGLKINCIFVDYSVIDFIFGNVSFTKFQFLSPFLLHQCYPQF